MRQVFLVYKDSKLLAVCASMYRARVYTFDYVVGLGLTMDFAAFRHGDSWTFVDPTTGRNSKLYLLPQEVLE